MVIAVPKLFPKLDEDWFVNLPFTNDEFLNWLIRKYPTPSMYEMYGMKIQKVWRDVFSDEQRRRAFLQYVEMLQSRLPALKIFDIKNEEECDDFGAIWDPEKKMCKFRRKEEEK